MLNPDDLTDLIEGSDILTGKLHDLNLGKYPPSVVISSFTNAIVCIYQAVGIRKEEFISTLSEAWDVTARQD